MIPKFRALNIKTGFWFDEQELVFCDGKWFQNWRSFEDDFPLNMRDCAVMQSTGLKDKNGVDVYQGDIIRCTRGCPHEVIWLEKYGGTFFGGMPAWYLSGLSNGYSWTGREEVIGNIWENSEFLEEQ
ncbi:DNA-packaging protein [Enterococcus faecium]|nr:DNA-packaging protein [Enterococcus faecium]